MSFLQLHVLCNKDNGSEEDRALAQQLAELGIPAKNSNTPEVVQEWRPCVININHIACMYPHAVPQHTVIHLYAGAVITLMESYPEILKLTNSVANKNYNYTAVLNKPVTTSDAG